MMTRSTGGANGSDDRGEGLGAEPDAAEARHQELVASLRRAIDRRDQRIEQLAESLDAETRAAEALRRELDELGSRVAGLERTLEHRTQTCYRLRELLGEARQAVTSAARAASADAAAVVEPEPAAEAESPLHERVVAIHPAARVRAAAPSSRRDAARAEGPKLVETMTVPDVASELLSPDMMLGNPEPRRPLIGSTLQAPEPPEPPAPRAPKPSGTAAPKRVSMALLSLDDDPPRKYAIDQDVVTIGRSRFSDVTIDSRLVSRLHARICIEDGRAEIEDLGSTNGVKVDSRRVERAELRDGDLIHLGRKRFRFVVEGE